MKMQAIKLLGGKCSICGYNKCVDALQFHHENPKEKEFKLEKQKEIQNQICSQFVVVMKRFVFWGAMQTKSSFQP